MNEWIFGSERPPLKPKPLPEQPPPARTFRRDEFHESSILTLCAIAPSTGPQHVSAAISTTGGRNPCRFRRSED